MNIYYFNIIFNALMILLFSSNDNSIPEAVVPKILGFYTDMDKRLFDVERLSKYDFAMLLMGSCQSFTNELKLRELNKHFKQLFPSCKEMIKQVRNYELKKNNIHVDIDNLVWNIKIYPENRDTINVSEQANMDELIEAIWINYSYNYARQSQLWEDGYLNLGQKRELVAFFDETTNTVTCPVGRRDNIHIHDNAQISYIATFGDWNRIVNEPNNYILNANKYILNKDNFEYSILLLRFWNLNANYWNAINLGSIVFSNKQELSVDIINNHDNVYPKNADDIQYFGFKPFRVYNKMKIRYLSHDFYIDNVLDYSNIIIGNNDGIFQSLNIEFRVWNAQDNIRWDPNFVSSFRLPSTWNNERLNQIKYVEIFMSFRYGMDRKINFNEIKDLLVNIKNKLEKMTEEIGKVDVLFDHVGTYKSKEINTKTQKWNIFWDFIISEYLKQMQ